MSQERKPDLYYFNQFVRTLMEENAEIKIFGKTYQSSNRKLTIRSLVGEICEFNSPSKLEDITRKTMELKKQITRKGRVSYNQENVLKELEFYFDTDVYNQKNNLGGHKFNKKDFYINGDGLISMLYPDISEQVFKKVLKHIEQYNFDELFEFISLSRGGNGPFSILFQKLIDEEFCSHKNLKQEVKNQFNQLGQEFNKAGQQSVNKNIPSYGISIPHTVGKVCNGVMEEHPEGFTYFFPKDSPRIDGNRYQDLSKILPNLFNIDIMDWPKWAIAHILLAELEYLCLRDCLVEIVLDEINNYVKFNLFTSKNGASLDLQNSIDDYQKLAKILSRYRFPGGIDYHLQIRRNTILIGDYLKNPNNLMTYNIESEKGIEYKLKRTLYNRMCTVLSNKIEYNLHFKDELLEFVEAEITDKIFTTEF